MWRTYLGFLILLAIFNVCHAQDNSEQIKKFNSQIQVNKDASIDVAETILVHANQNKIIHGIVRKLRTRYTDSYGVNRHSNYQIKEILMNNQTATYHLDHAEDQLSIYIGASDVTLQPGDYTYTLRYRVNDAVIFLKDADEFYWNITGNNWDFPILNAEANIFLPPGANILHYAGYTGFKGAKNQNFTIDQTEPNQISYATTQALSPGEGLTVAVSWPKGIIQKPTFLQKVQRSFAENEGQTIVLEILVFLLIYFLIVWYLYGRDPRAGTIIPLFEPPLNLSPASMRFIMRKGFDMKTLSTAIVSLATKGKIVIDKTDADEIRLLKQKQNGEQLPDDESNVLNTIFNGSDIITFGESKQQVIKKTLSNLKKTLQEKYEKVYFVTNNFYFMPGLLLTILAFGLTILVSSNSQSFNAFLMLAGWTYVCYLMIHHAYDAITQCLNNFSLMNLIKAIFLPLFTLPFLAFGIVAFFILNDVIPTPIILLLVLIVILDTVFQQLLKATTIEGRKVMDQIEGFKLFLSTTERYRLNQIPPTQITPELFEKYLPYAIALNVENAWGTKFNQALATAGIPQTTSYQPTWYTGQPLTLASIASFPTFLDSSITGSISSSSSSSASGGGGSSGGGGGGGGGGGW